jgi:hypothetical protein
MSTKRYPKGLSIKIYTPWNPSMKFQTIARKNTLIWLSAAFCVELQKTLEIAFVPPSVETTVST